MTVESKVSFPCQPRQKVGFWLTAILYTSSWRIAKTGLAI